MQRQKRVRVFVFREAKKGEFYKLVRRQGSLLILAPNLAHLANSLDLNGKVFACPFTTTTVVLQAGSQKVSLLLTLSDAELTMSPETRRAIKPSTSFISFVPNYLGRFTALRVLSAQGARECNMANLGPADLSKYCTVEQFAGIE